MSNPETRGGNGAAVGAVPRDAGGRAPGTADPEAAGLGEARYNDALAGDVYVNHGVLTSAMTSGVYKIPSIQAWLTNVMTNTTPVAAYRGAGRPEATYLVERTVDLVAAECGLDPAEVRRRNFIGPDEFPYTSPANPDLVNYDSGDYPAALAECLRIGAQGHRLVAAGNRPCTDRDRIAAGRAGATRHCALVDQAPGEGDAVLVASHFHRLGTGQRRQAAEQQRTDRKNRKAEARRAARACHGRSRAVTGGELGSDDQLPQRAVPDLAMDPIHGDVLSRSGGMECVTATRARWAVQAVYGNQWRRGFARARQRRRPAPRRCSLPGIAGLK